MRCSSEPFLFLAFVPGSCAFWGPIRGYPRKGPPETDRGNTRSHVAVGGPCISEEAVKSSFFSCSEEGFETIRCSDPWPPHQIAGGLLLRLAGQIRASSNKVTLTSSYSWHQNRPDLRILNCCNLPWTEEPLLNRGIGVVSRLGSLSLPPSLLFLLLLLWLPKYPFWAL